jgi:hypothetical protein
LKLPLLLTQYLYKYKKLNLPGLGSFTLDPSAVLPDDHSKNEHAAAMGIEFKRGPVTQPDADLIEFIRVHTGKIRPLAIADLDSFLTLGTELLNIGKPFYLEGIGTLTKGQDGKIEYSQGEYTTSRMDDPRTEFPTRASRAKPSSEEAHFETEPQQGGSRKTVVIVAIVAGLIVVGWGGYQLYKKNAPAKPETESTMTVVNTKNEDSIRNAIISDSLAALKEKVTQAPSMSDSTMMKFIILQTHNKERALKRYNQLLSYFLKVKMDTNDSSFFKVYFAFPARMKDTVHIKDSLEREYAHRVVIER